MFIALSVLLCLIIIVSYVLFAMSHDRYTDIPHPEIKKDYALSFVPGYFLWFLIRTKLESFDKED